MTRLTHFLTGVALSLPVLLSGVAPSTAGAQSADEQAAYVALYYTPVAGLPPLAPSIDSSGPGKAPGVALHGRFGRMSRRGGLSIATYGIGIEMPMGRTSLGATLAYLSATCGEAWGDDPDCDGDIMIGGSVRTLLASRPLGEPPPPPPKGKSKSAPSRTASDAGTLIIGFDGSAGFSPRQGEQALAIAAGLPMGIVLRSGTVRILPFITPGLGYGRLGNVEYVDDEAPTSHGAITFMVGGGFGLEFGTSGIGASLGFQKVLKSDGGGTQIGLGLTWHGVTAR